MKKFKVKSMVVLVIFIITSIFNFSSFAIIADNTTSIGKLPLKYPDLKPIYNNDLKNVKKMSPGKIKNSSNSSVNSKIDFADSTISSAIPPNIWISNITSNTTTLNWDAGFDCYQVNKKALNGNWELLYFGTNTSYTDTAAAVGTAYSVIGYDGYKWTSWSFYGGSIFDAHNVSYYNVSEAHCKVVSKTDRNILTVPEYGTCYQFFKWQNGSWVVVQNSASNTYTDTNVTANQSTCYSIWVYNNGWIPVLGGGGNITAITPSDTVISYSHHERAFVQDYNNSLGFDGCWMQANIPSIYPKDNEHRVNFEFWFKFDSNDNGTIKSWVEYLVSRGDNPGTFVEFAINYNYNTGEFDDWAKYPVTAMNSGENHTLGCVYNSSTQTFDMRSDGVVTYHLVTQNGFVLGNNRDISAGTETHKTEIGEADWDDISLPTEIYNLNVRCNGTFTNWSTCGGTWAVQDEMPSNNVDVSFDGTNNRILFN